MNKLSKVQDLCLSDTYQMGKEEVLFNLQDKEKNFGEQNIVSDTILLAIIKIKSTVTIMIKDMNRDRVVSFKSSVSGWRNIFNKKLKIKVHLINVDTSGIEFN